MTYAKAIQFLYDLQIFGAELGLEKTFKLAALAGNPQDKLRFIHVAGTNGKGSTCAMLESIYRASDLRVGLYTSPHLVSFRERIQVNRELIGEADVVRLVAEMKTALREFPADHPPTFFEVVTVMALRYFAEQKCDLVIWETGLGGRLDATNIVTPLASVITNIGLDHQQWLGETLGKIAAEKAGIIKTGVPALTTATATEVLQVIKQTAEEKKSPLTVVSASGLPALDAPPLLGQHQRLNAALALATVEVLHSRIPVSREQIHEGLAKVDWPGRMQLFAGSSGQKILLDGAHNPDGAAALRAALQTEFPEAGPALILGIFRDKDSTGMCRLLAPLAGRLLLTPVHSERTEDPAKLMAACREANPNAPIEICASLAAAMEKSAHEPFVVIAGSLYLVGEAMELLKLGPSPANDEKSLNEWTQVKTPDGANLTNG